MIPKPDVDFTSEENQFNYIFAENYNPTGLTRHDFRTVFVKELQNSTGEKSFFAIFKTWPLLDSEYNQFKETYAGQQVGLSIDGLVTPVTVPVDSPTSSSTGTTVEVPGLLAIGVNGGADQAELLDILYNSGVIPVEYQVVGDSDSVISGSSLQYIQIMLSVLATILAFAIYLYVRKEKFELFSFVAEVFLTLGLWLAFLKLTIYPIDTSVLLLAAILGILFVKMVHLRSEYRIYTYILSLSILVISLIFGVGYIKDLSTQMIVIITASLVAQGFTKLYLDNLNEVFKK
jgi:hypothetical protein